jgi:predicted esterase
MSGQRCIALILAAVTGWILSASRLWADLVIFKDGFILEGKVKQPGRFEVDPGSGQPYWQPQGFFLLDTPVRRIYFSHSQVDNVEGGESAPDNDPVILQRTIGHFHGKAVSPLVQILGTTPWNDKWERTLRMQTTSGPADIKQRVVVLTPQIARVEALNRTWGSTFLTRELGIETIRKFLASHPDLKLKGDASDAGRRLRVFRFLLQAGYYDEAEKELDEIQKAFPEEKDKIETGRQNLQKLRTLRLYEDIEHGHRAGRHYLVEKQLATFPDSGVDEKLQAHVRALRSLYETANANLSTARRLLQQLPLEVDAAQEPFFREAAGVIAEELTFENVGRLEVFLNQAQQAERLHQKGEKTEESPAQLLALAISGWLQGKDAADNKIETAQRLWRGRQFVLEYERAPSAGRRERLLQHYREVKTDALAVDEMAQLIGFLPPPEPDTQRRDEPLSFKTEPSAARKRGVSYLVQLPPEFHPGRPCPVLFALGLGGEKAQVMFDRIGRVAADRGYLVVVPDWGVPMEDVYQFTAEEHAAVLDVLHDLRRHFPVDSDRVFLLGFGQGGNMAFDVGLSHPDLFAGVIPIGAEPRRFVNRYWPNCQYLPLYIVDGSNSGENPKNLRPLLERWIPHGYPVIYVEYKGRGIEWYSEEMPFILEWMDRKREQKKRAQGVPELGKSSGGEEFQSMRPTDNHFYWLSSDAISERHWNIGNEWKANMIPATFQAKILEGNQINVNVRGLKKVSVWLGRDMIDFSKPVTVRINGVTQMTNRKAEPKLETLLEDFWQRGDRQRLFWARLDFDRF